MTVAKKYCLTGILLGVVAGIIGALIIAVYGIGAFCLYVSGDSQTPVDVVARMAMCLCLLVLVSNILVGGYIGYRFGRQKSLPGKKESMVDKVAMATALAVALLLIVGLCWEYLYHDEKTRQDVQTSKLEYDARQLGSAQAKITQFDVLRTPSGFEFQVAIHTPGLRKYEITIKGLDVALVTELARGTEITQTYRVNNARFIHTYSMANPLPQGTGGAYRGNTAFVITVTPVLMADESRTWRQLLKQKSWGSFIAMAEKSLPLDFVYTSDHYTFYKPASAQKLVLSSGLY